MYVAAELDRDASFANVYEIVCVYVNRACVCNAGITSDHLPNGNSFEFDKSENKRIRRNLVGKLGFLTRK